jgi:hypothetical protein
MTKNNTKWRRSLITEKEEGPCNILSDERVTQSWTTPGNLRKTLRMHRTFWDSTRDPRCNPKEGKVLKGIFKDS